MESPIEALLAAMNRHDASAIAALVTEDYESSQPTHPARGFGGRAQVVENWTEVFTGVPDFAAEILSSCTDSGRSWVEWRWHGHHAEGSRFEMRGVTIFDVAGGLIRRGRLYMEPVEALEEDITAAVRELYRAGDR